MTVSSRLLKLEQRPQPQRPHGMTNEQLLTHLTRMTDREKLAFVKTMTDDDLSDSISFLKTTLEQSHANT